MRIEKILQLPRRELYQTMRTLAGASPEHARSVLFRGIREAENFNRLPVLEAMRKSALWTALDLRDYYLIAGQHCLGTTGSLLQWLRDACGLKMKKTYLVGKSYSNNARVVEKLKSLGLRYQANSEQLTLGAFPEAYETDISQLYAKLLTDLKRGGQGAKGVIVLDDGGHLFKKFPREISKIKNLANIQIPVIGIEQTSSGVASSRIFPFPIIEVATSAAKQLEPASVVGILKKQLDKDLLAKGGSSEALKNLCYGIAGFGNVGKAVFHLLRQSGCDNVIFYDQKSPDNSIEQPKRIVELPHFIRAADVIVGCTGEDFMKIDFPACLEAMESRERPIIFASASSKDTEFNSLLRHIHSNNRNGAIDPLGDIPYPKHNPMAIILGGGMPLNFKQVHTGESEHSVPPEEIQLTRGLLAAAVLQAKRMMEDKVVLAEQYQLDSAWQSFIVNAWTQDRKEPQLTTFQDLDWISQHSLGKPLETGVHRIKLKI